MYIVRAIVYTPALGGVEAVTTQAVLGAGGIGGLIGGALSRAGDQVILVLRPETLRMHPPSLRVESTMLGDFEVPVRITARLEEPVDVLWVTVKAPQLEEAIRAVPPSSVAGALVVTLMNGVDHVARLRAAYPEATVVAGSIRTESTRVKPGHIVHKGWHAMPADRPPADPSLPRPTKAVQLCGAGTAREPIENLAARLEAAGVPCQVWDDEGYLLWSKLSILCPYALATTAVAGPIGAVRADAHILERMMTCVREVLAVTEALGIRLDTQETLSMIDRFPDTMRVSMERDSSIGRPLEIEAVSRPVIDEGRKHGIDVSATEELRERALASSGAIRERLRAS